MRFSDAIPKALSWASTPSKTESSEVRRYSDTEDNVLLSVVDVGPRRLPMGEKPSLKERRVAIPFRILPDPKLVSGERRKVLAPLVRKLPRCSRLLENVYARR